MHTNIFIRRFIINIQLVEQFGKVNIVDSFVDDQTHCAFSGMRADINNRACKPIVSHCLLYTSDAADE